MPAGYNPISRRPSQSTMNLPLSLAFLALIPLSYGVYIVPYSYDLTVQLPINQTKFLGSLLFQFTLLTPSTNITLHSRNLYNFRNISLLSSSDFSEPGLKSIKILSDTVEFSFLEQLPKGKYLLTVGEYSGSLRNDSVGLFYRSNGLVATHFQTDYARTFLPCIDLPYVKAPFRMSVIHPTNTVSQSNTIANDVHIVDTTWQKTVFAPTPNLPAYLLSVSVMPDNYVQLSGQTSFGVTLRVNAVSKEAAARVLDVAIAAFELIANMLEVPLPLNKIDFILVPGYEGGIENWGHVIVSEGIANTANDAHVAYVIAHELVHHWIGDKVTVNSWKWTCLQEDLTDYISYKIVASLFNGDQRYERFRLSKYVEIQLAEDFVSHNHSLELPEKIDNEMITNHCYLKGVVFLESLGGFIGEGTLISIIRNLLSTRSTFDLDLFADYFQNYSTPDGIPLSQIYQFWYRTGGYPEILVLNTDNKTTIAQRGNSLWPLRIPNVANLPQFMITAVSEFDTVMSPNLINLNFTSFVRVNYDAETWSKTFSFMRQSPNFFSATGRAQLVSDFCYFHNQGLVENGTDIKTTVLDMIYDSPEHFELCDWNLYWCTYTMEDSIGATLFKSLLVNFSLLFRDDIQYGCKRGGAAKTINTFCNSLFGKNCI